MSKTASPKNSTRNRFSPAFKQDALALADRVGAAEAARQLGLQAAQLYAWRSKAQQEQKVMSVPANWRPRMLDSSACWLNKPRIWRF